MGKGRYAQFGTRSFAFATLELSPQLPVSTTVHYDDTQNYHYMVYRTISKDVKELALTLMMRGLALDEVANLLSVSERSIYRWKKNFSDYQEVEKPPTAPRGRPRVLTPEILDVLHILLQHEPSSFLHEMQIWILLEYGINVSVPTIQRNLSFLGLTHKKLTTLARERNDNKRFEWIEWVNEYFTASQIVCTDESYKDARTHARTYGRAMRGIDAFELTAFVRGERYSILPALTTEGVIAAEVIKGPVNGEMFIAFILNKVVSLL